MPEYKLKPVRKGWIRLSDLLPTDSKRQIKIGSFAYHVYLKSRDRDLPKTKKVLKKTKQLRRDAKFYTDGFNTKNKMVLKKGSPLPTTISQDLTLTKENSPYVASKKTTIKKGATLTINAGVEVHLEQDATIECSGNFKANGTSSEPIVFMPNNNASAWDYIYFYEPSDSAYFNHV